MIHDFLRIIKRFFLIFFGARGRSRGKWRRGTNKPDSVHPPRVAPPRTPVIPLSDLPGTSRRPRRPPRPPPDGPPVGSLFDLAPGWACLARTASAARRWSLAPPFHYHRRLRGGYLFSVALFHRAGFPRAFRRRPAEPPPCGVRTFLAAPAHGVAAVPPPLRDRSSRAAPKGNSTMRAAPAGDYSSP